MPLTCQEYVFGQPILDPVYVDANVWVSYFVPARADHAGASNAITHLLSQGEILISTLVFSEIWWSVLWHTFDRQQPSLWPGGQSVGFSRKVLTQNKTWLFKMAESQLRQVSATIASMPPVKMVPGDTVPMSATPDIMLEHQLPPADSIHLSLAAEFGRSFLTADRGDFANLVDPSSSLGIYLL